MGNAKFSHLIDWANHNKGLGTPMAVKYYVDFNSSLGAWECVWSDHRVMLLVDLNFQSSWKSQLYYSLKEGIHFQLVVATVEVKISLSTQSKLSGNWTRPTGNTSEMTCKKSLFTLFLLSSIYSFIY